MTTRDSEAGFDLAIRVKSDLLDRVPQPDAACILHCCCWLLADVITQAAAEEDGLPVVDALAVVMVTLSDAVARLTLANAIDDVNLEATKH